MQYRGPILLIFGLSLMASPLAVRLAEEARSSAPGQVETMGARAANCAAQTIRTGPIVIGCEGRKAALDNRRQMGGGGALFVASR
jgi:hypothetical protein